MPDTATLPRCRDCSRDDDPCPRCDDWNDRTIRIRVEAMTKERCSTCHFPWRGFVPSDARLWGEWRYGGQGTCPTCTRVVCRHCFGRGTVQGIGGREIECECESMEVPE